jgi:DnaK suppressor protein
VLTADQTSELRKKLEAERERIVAKAHEALDFAMGRDPERVGRDSIDASVEEGLYSTELRLHDREKRLLGKIEQALERLEKGEIDECEDCGEEIGFKRLLARPVTPLCVLCKQDREDGEAATGPVPRSAAFTPEE